MEISENYCRIYITRHGQTEFNVKEIMQGQIDSPLTEEGKAQAKEFAEKFKNIKFEAIFSSDLGRAQATAEIINIDRQLVINTSKLLRERSFGPYDGTPSQKFRDENKVLFEKRQTLSEQEKRDFKFYESYESDSQIASRMITALREIAVTYLGKTVLVISHGAIIRALLVHLGYAQFDELGTRAIGNGAYIMLKCDGTDFFIENAEGITKV